MSISAKKFPNLVLWSRGKDDTLLELQGNVEELYGYSKQDFYKNSNLWFELIHPEDKEYLQKAQKLLNEKEEGSVNVQYRVIRADNKIRNLLGVMTKTSENGTVVYSGYVVDVSYRKQEKELETHKKSLLNLLGDSISKSFNLEKDRLERVNEVLGRLGEITNADRVYIFNKKSGDNNRPILNQNYEWCREGVDSQMENNVLFDVDLKEMTPRWYQKLVAERSYVSGIVRHFPDEEREALEPQGIISLLVTPIWYDNEFFGFIGFDDCTEERVWNEEEIELLIVFGSLIMASWIYEDSFEIIENQLKEVRKLQSEREQFLKMVSHQFKTPLSVIRLNSELIAQVSQKMPGNETKIIQKKIGRIESSIQKFEELIEAILIGNSPQLLEKKPESLLVEDWFEDFISSKKENFQELNSITLNRSKVINKSVQLPFSLKTFDYILDTLFSNAIKYRGEQKADISISYDMEEGNLKIIFKDEGIGIRREDLPKVANPFFRANNVINISGTGIGLSMVKDSIHSVDGKFEISSEINQYTKVEISIPIGETE